LETKLQILRKKSTFQAGVNLNLRDESAAYRHLRVRTSKFLGPLLFPFEFAGVISDVRPAIPTKQQSTDV
jgi:hypothetical protein